MTGHRQLWNAIIHSRETWPIDHPFHDLDLFLYAFLAILVAIGYIVWMDIRFSRWSKKLETTPSSEVDFLERVDHV